MTGPAGIALAGIALAGLACAGCGLTGSDEPATTSARSTVAASDPPSTQASSPAGGSPGASSTAVPSSGGSPAGGSSAGVSPRASRPAPASYRFPIAGRTSFGRAHHDYPATDIFAACGSPVLAPADGVIQEVSRTDVWSRSANAGATRGGLSFSLVGSDGVRYYGSHLRSIGADITPGHPVRAGDPIGAVGRTGDAADVACHLHFGISPACGPGDWWTRRGAVSPYAYLKAWQRRENLSPARAVAAWKAANGCPKS